MADSSGSVSSPTVRLTTWAMACEFAVVLNRDDREYADAASFALERVHTLEECMTVYRSDSELVRLNATTVPTEVSEDLSEVIATALELSEHTEGRFDPTSGPLIELWRRCREEKRIPEQAEVQVVLRQVGAGHASISDRVFRRANDVELNLGAIGKGYALDEAGAVMTSRGAQDWLLHGGRSSILASGNHEQRPGWPVGLGNPVFTNKRLGIVWLRDQAMGTSGSNIQYFRHAGERYGHILDPRTGWPARELASVTVLAETAAEADALSTAFFVGGVEFARSYCDNRPTVSAILIPFPEAGKLIEPVLANLPPDRISWSDDQVKLT